MAGEEVEEMQLRRCVLIWIAVLAALAPAQEQGPQRADEIALQPLDIRNAARLADAESLHREAPAMQKAQCPPDDWAIALTLYNLGVIQRVRGNPSAALNSPQEARALYAPLSGASGRQMYARTLVETSNCLWLLKKPYDAEPLLREAAGIFSSLDPPDRVSEVLALNTLGGLFVQLSDPQGGQR
jgi:hypothetical protein